MILTVKVSLELGDAYTDYDRLALGDSIVHDIKKLMKDRKDVNLIDIEGVINK